MFEDDRSFLSFHAPAPVYRFERDGRTAYARDGDDGWLVRPWQRQRGRVSKVVVHASTLRGALDVLLRDQRPWWWSWRR
jgi:hypothetical protein